MHRAWRQLLPLALVGAAVVLSATVVGMLDSRAPASPHGVRIAVVSQGPVALALAEESLSLPGRPFDVVATTDSLRATDDVAAGRLPAALLVDPLGTRDVLLAGTTVPLRLATAVTARLRALETARGRTLSVTPVGPDAGAAATAARRLVVAGVAAGLGLGLLLSGPGPAGRRRRVLVVAGAAVVGAGWAVAWSVGRTGPPPGARGTAVAVLALAALVLVTACPGVALQRLHPWTGHAAAATAVVASTVPVVLDRVPGLVPAPWQQVLAATPPTAARATFLQAMTGRSPTTADAVVLLAWAVPLLAAVLLTGARAAAPAVGSTDAARRHARLRVLAVLVPLSAASVGLVATAPGTTAGAPTATDTRATTTPCLSLGTVRTVSDLNRVSRLRGTAAFRGGDVGADALLQDGRHLWLFGDTLRDTPGAGRGFVRNSMLLVDRACIRVVTPQGGGAIIPDRPAGPGGPAVGYWPMSVTVRSLPGYDIAYVTAQRVRTTGTGAFDFENLGGAVAAVLVPRGGVPQVLEVRDLGPDRASRTATQWGAATATRTGPDGAWLYVFGTDNPDTAGVFGYALRVARVRPGDLLDTTRWRYWDGTRWNASAERAAALVPARRGVSQTLSVFARGGTWYAVSKRDDFLGTALTVWKAPSPTGPWDDGTTVATIGAPAGQLRYMPLAHPDLLPEKGTVVVSYSTNDADVSAVIADPLRYRPVFLRARLP